MKSMMLKIWWFIDVLLLFGLWGMWIFAAEFTTFNLILTLSFVLLTIVLLIVSRKELTAFYRTRLCKNLISNGITIGLVLSIIGISNYMAFKNDITFDVTKDRVHTLSDQSKKILASLNSHLELTLFAKRQDWNKYSTLLNQYKTASKLVELNFVDIEQSPVKVKQYNIKENGSIVLKYKNTKVVGVVKSELSLTNLIFKILRNKKVNVYYTIGHGEINFQDNSKNGGSYLLKVMQNANYNVIKLDLLSAASIPQDADVVLVLGAVNGMLDLELKKIKQFLDRGGNVFFSLSPNFLKKNLKNVYAFLKENSIEVIDSIILDRLSAVEGVQATIPLVTNINVRHPITKDFKSRILFPLTVALKPRILEKQRFVWLGKSSNFPASWAETNLDQVSSGNATFDKRDFKGPLMVSAVVENSKSNSKMAVTGSTSMFVNGYESHSTNFNFFLNTLSWLVDDEAITAINRPALTQERVFLGSSQITLILWVSVAFIPFSFFVFGIIIYRRRLNS